MFFGKIAMLAAMVMAPAVSVLPHPVPATGAAAPNELADLGRWNEVTLPGAPFRIDMPMPLTFAGEKAIGTSNRKTWKTNYGLMSIEVSFMDRPGPTSFTPRQTQEMLAGGLVKDWKNPLAKVSDVNVLGHAAARLELEHDVDSGRIRTERLLIRVGDDDWTVQTTRFVGRGDDLDSMHVFRSIRAPALPPVLTETRVGRMTIKGFGKPVVTRDKLAGDTAATYEHWTTYAFDYQGTTKAWIYHLKYKPGNAFDPAGFAKQQIDNVRQQSRPNIQVYDLPQQTAGLPGHFARGQAITGEGEECFRILAVGDGPEGWVLLLAGPNSARTESLLREMIASIQVAR
jgi:hypothetical protein